MSRLCSPPALEVYYVRYSTSYLMCQQQQKTSSNILPLFKRNFKQFSKRWVIVDDRSIK